MIKLFKNPITRFLLFLILGILYSEQLLNIISIKSIVIILVILFLLYLIFIRYYYISHKLRWTSGLLSLCFILLLGALLKEYNSPEIYNGSRNIKTTGAIHELKRGNSGWTQITFKPLSDSLKNQKWLITIKNEFTSELSENDLCHIKGVLQPTLTTKTVTSFDYQKYLRENGFSGQMFISDSTSIKLIKSDRNFNLKTAPAYVKNFCEDIFVNSGLNKTSMSIIKALLLGDRTEIDRDINQQFIESGVVHILAVSGLHVGIIYLIINTLLSLIFNQNSSFKWVIAIILLVSYAFVTGFSPSVSRAVLMFSLIQLGQASKREVGMIQLVILSAFILLLIQPNFVYNAGFWLSHLAVIGIVAFQPLIFKLTKFKFPIWQWAWSIASVSLAAQIGTMPYSLYVFGSFPTYFIIANILILPVVAPLLILAFLLLALSFSPFLTAMISGVINDIIYYMVSITKWINRLPSSYLENMWVSIIFAAALYLFLHTLYKLYISTSAKNIIQFLTMILISFTILNMQFYSKISNNHIVFYETKRGVLIDYFYKGTAITIQSTDISDEEKKRERNNIAKKFLIKQGAIIEISNDEPLIKRVKFKENNYFIASNFNKKTFPLIEENNINGVFLSNIDRESWSSFVTKHKPPLVISSHNIYGQDIASINDINLEKEFSLYSLKVNGTKIISK